MNDPADPVDGVAEPGPAHPPPATVELLLRVGSGERHRDVVVGADTEHTVAELATALAARLGLDPASGVALVSPHTGRTLRSDATLGEVDLLSGDQVDVRSPGGDGPGPTAGPGRRSLALDVVAGPDAGRSFPLGPGRYTIGRRHDRDIAIGDPTVSRRHADLAIAGSPTTPPDGWTITVEPDPACANGVTVDDEPIGGPTALPAGAVLALGGTRLVVRTIERPPAGPGGRGDRRGGIEFHRTPYRPPVVGDRTTDPIGPIPERPAPRRLPLSAALAPLVAGLLMFAFTRQVQFLALTLISPIVTVASVVEDRRSGRRDFRRRLPAFRDRLADDRRRFEELRRREREERSRAAPDLADLVRRAELRTIDLWARGRTAPDFLAVRLGLGTARVGYPIELADGGAPDLRDEARSAVAGLDTIDHVPVTVDLVAEPVLGIHGAPELVDGVAAALLLQAATLHSPEDLVIATATAPERPLGWAKWLPHVRSVTSPLPGDHVAGAARDADALVARLVEVAAFRTRVDSGHDRGDAHRWPRILAVLDGDLSVDPAQTSGLLDVAPAAGISVVWLATSASAIPRHAARVLEVGHGDDAAMAGRLWSTDPTVDDRRVEVEHLRGSTADRAARALAPVRDASTASLATSIPRSVPLLDVLGVGRPTGRWIADRWRRCDGAHLRFPIGTGADGPLELDLVHDGPHALIGGTSGSGKSELLQSLVAGLAAHHPPTRLNFLFVDYKGGAASQVFERLPHTVGYVTNLATDLAMRALTSLRAELDRRMAAMEGRAKDLAEMVARWPDEAPAALVIVVDEFATLVKEVPEFVAGIVDIAQRGRSLGIHLVLATQRPSGSVDENILANTNLRISLRMLDRAESTAIIDSPQAAAIPVPLKGRALVRLGPRRLVEFQSAFAGAPLVDGAARRPVRVEPFGASDGASDGAPIAPIGRPPTDVAPPAANHLDVVIDAIVDAAGELALPVPRRPWREVLPALVPLADLLASAADPRTAADPGRFVTIGLLDEPERQDQRPAVIDLEDRGGWLIFGSGGSGKTTALRTSAAAIHAAGESSSDRRDHPAAIVVFDFASRALTALRALPDVVEVATGDDLEAVTRHLTVLDGELERRRRLLADAGAEHLTAYRHGRHAAGVPRIVVMIDGFGELWSTLTEAPGGAASVADHWRELLLRLVVDGRQVGIHSVITADRRSAVPARLHASIGNRLILRHADDASYAEHGIGADRRPQLDDVPGRGLLDGADVVQVATISNDPSARAQNDAIVALARRSERRSPRELASRPLPESYALADLDASGRPAAGGALLGRADVTGRPVAVDLEWSHLTVCGPPRSGRSTALATVAAGLRRHHDVIAVGPARSPLAAVRLPGSGFGGVDRIAPVLDRLAEESATGGRRRVLVVDDVDALDDPVLAPWWERLAGLDGLRFAVSLEQRSMTGYATSTAVDLARRARRLLVLQPDDAGEFLQTTGVKLPVRPGLRMPPGRGVLLVDRVPTIVHVATAIDR